MSDTENMLLNPQQGCKFIGRPQGVYDLPFTVLDVDHTGVTVETDKNKVSMRIERKDWDAYVTNITIRRAEQG